MDTLMKNVYTFADIVRQAGGDAVTHWNDKSIQNAFNWADYCQRVYRETEGRPYQAELDRHIKTLSLYMSSPCCLDLSLDALQHAEILLIQTLVENPLLPTRLLKDVVDICVKSEVKLDSFTKVCSESCENRTIVHTFEEILDQLGVSTEECRLESQAETLLAILTSHYQYSNNRERYQQFVSRVLKHLTKDREGWKILRHLSYMGKDDTSQKERKNKEKKERYHSPSSEDDQTKRPSLEDVQKMVFLWIEGNKD
ncbi:uncharacterized protein LOC117329799 [Pecten maximus]|uniref:uncharacterized protein LOC117329799 n=1 Tax=Pecten maximus TaxID=6579 RepID=UPI001457FD10|nr:uncharacterized protein LOC117329799 [Pecten maximus]